MKKYVKIASHSQGLVDVPGFSCSGTPCDIRKKNNDRLDLAIIFSEKPCQVAGMFTRNAVKAAPVQLCQKTLSLKKTVHAIVANSGNANACTGKQGMKDAQAMQKLTAQALGVSANEVLVCSTGRIGEFLPMETIGKGILAGAGKLGREEQHGLDAANAILTSDTRPKKITVRFTHENKTVTVAGIAKGAGMIQPNMATMLAFVATDAQISRALLAKVLKQVVDSSFNAITVDGDASTNDTVIALANGESALKISQTDTFLLEKFTAAMQAVCRDLAYKIVGDGERITKVVTLQIKNAKSRSDAEAIARAIGNSLLVKTSWFGSDPNWGRLLDAAGYAGAELVEEKITLQYKASPVSKGAQAVIALRKGKSFPENKPRWKEIVREKEFTIEMDMGLGKADFTLLATDLSTGYVDFNKSE